MKTASNVDDDSDDEEELYLQGTLIPRTPATLSIILEPPPPRRSTQGQGIRDRLYYLHKHKPVINLRSFWTRFFFLSIYCIEQKRSQNRYTGIDSNQYKDESDNHEFRE